jgi:hypothetical protein
MIIVENTDNTNAFNRRRRSTGNHSIGESMPGTVGDAQRALHDKNGQTPVIDDTVEIPSTHHEQQTEKTTEDNGADVEELVAKLQG